MKNPLVSICIPAYNAERYIAECLDSIYRQTYRPVEVIVVNDGSTDNTLGVLQKYVDRDLIIINQSNAGQCSAANTAFHASTGSLIKFLDADDLISESFIERQVDIISEKNDVIASAGWGRFYNNDLNTFKLNPESVWRDMTPIDWLVESLESGHNMMQCGLWLIPRGILLRSGLWDERLSLINDFDFFIRVLLQARIVKFTPETILYYRSGMDDSLSKQRSRKAFESACLSTELGCSTILSYENSCRTRKVCANSFKMWVYYCYPYHKDLSRRMETEVRRLGGSRIKYPAGGLTKLLLKLLGWKLGLRIKTWILCVRNTRPFKEP